jgi:15-cis-phytoene synthase
MGPVELAYEECRRIARESGSSFYSGMRLLPAERGAARVAVYARARRIDDIADGSLGSAEKLAALAAVRARLSSREPEGDATLIAVFDAAARYPIPLDAFGDLIAGAELDARGERFETFRELEHYCRCVAGSIGRLSLGVFECSDRTSGSELADELGVALQIGNILRDIGEDATSGRLYLPREDLDRFGCNAHNGVSDRVVFDGPIELVIAFEAERGLERLREGLALVPLLDRRSASCVLAMAGKYRRLLERIAADPALSFRGRLTLRPWEKGLVLARSLAGAGV